MRRRWEEEGAENRGGNSMDKQEEKVKEEQTVNNSYSSPVQINILNIVGSA